MIERSHRIGPKKRSMNSEAKTRPIIAKFVSYRDRQVVFNSKKLLKESGFVITESLTKKRMSLLNEGRKTVGSKNIWTLDGRIHVKLDDKLYIINKLSDLDRFKTLSVCCMSATLGAWKEIKMLRFSMFFCV